MIRHGLFSTLAAHHASWAAGQRMPVPDLRKPSGQTASETIVRHGPAQPETTLIRQPCALPDQHRWPARTTPKPIYP
jgi:hypothetical protein